MSGLVFSKFTTGTWYGMKSGIEGWRAGDHCLRLNVKSNILSIDVGILSFDFPFTTTQNIINFVNVIPFVHTSVNIQAWILDTDYNKYAVLYICGTFKYSSNGMAYFSSPLVLFRNRSLIGDYDYRIYQALGNNKLESKNLSTHFSACSA